MENGEGLDRPTRSPLNIIRGIKQALTGRQRATNPVAPVSEVVQPGSDIVFSDLGLENTNLDESDTDAFRVFETDKERFNQVMLDIRDMEASRLETDMPDGFIESHAVGIYPFSERYVSLLALRTFGFDIRLLAPMVSGTEVFDHDLHDEVRTVVRPEEHEKIESILFTANGYRSIGWSRPPADREPYTNTAQGTLGNPYITNFEAFKTNTWHEVLDTTLRANTYFINADIFRSGHFAPKQSGFADSYDQLIKEGVLQRVYMTSHIMHDLVYRHRDVVKKTGDFDKQVYKLFKDNGIEPYGPEELVGIAHRMIREILEEHPEWAPTQGDVTP